MKLILSSLFSLMFFISWSQGTRIPTSIYAFKVAAIDGRIIDLAKFKGKKILIVNTPVLADHSLQYSELDALYKKYKDKLIVIGFLANDFQLEPGSRTNQATPKHYDVSFPLAEKVIVRGDSLSPIYQWLTQKKYNHLKNTAVGWDFQKYLLDTHGKLISVFDPRTKASSPEIIDAVEK